MSDVALAHAQHGLGPRRLGLLLFVSSETLVFLSVIAMYVSGNHAGHPNPQESLSAGKMVPYSIALWASSGTIWLASRSISRGSQSGMRLWLLATIVLGGAFLIGELTEWLELFGERITAASNVWGSAFFTLTGIHGMHVIVGLLMMLALIGSSFRFPIPHSGESSLEIISLYWHFVDAMWILIYGVVYLWSAALGG